MVFPADGKDHSLQACVAFPAAGKGLHLVGLHGFSSGWKRQKVYGLYCFSRPWKNYIRKEKNNILLACMAFPAIGRTTACWFEWLFQALEKLHPQRKEPHLDEDPGGRLGDPQATPGTLLEGLWSTLEGSLEDPWRTSRRPHGDPWGTSGGSLEPSWRLPLKVLWSFGKSLETAANTMQASRLVSFPAAGKAMHRSKLWAVPAVGKIPAGWLAWIFQPLERMACIASPVAERDDSLLACIAVPAAEKRQPPASLHVFPAA
jgi:hypothetical protein